MADSTGDAPRFGQDAVPPPRRDSSNLWARHSGTTTRQTRDQPAPAVTPTPAPAAPARRRTRNTGDTAPARPRGTRRPQTASAAAPTTQAPEPAPATGRASTAADAHVKRQRILSLPDTVYEQLAMRRATARATNTQVVLAAIEHAYPRLPQLVEHDLSPTVVAGALWDTVQDQRPKAAKRQVWFEPTQQQLEVIDRLREEAGARDRSHLVAVALQDYLEGDT